MHFIWTFFFAIAAGAVKIPGPPGPFSVAYQVYPLTDESRWDPYAPKNDTHKRRILVSAFIPSQDAEPCTVDTIPYMPLLTAITYGQYAAGYGLPGDLFEGFEYDFCRLPGGAKAKNVKKYPLVVFSPGLTASRLLYGAQARALASYGYIVITVDHPYDATLVEFPDGTSYDAINPPISGEEEAAVAAAVRTADVSFLLDQLNHCSHGNHFENSLLKRIDFGKIVAYGHSLGGATAASVAYSDPRVLGGCDIDGTPYGPVTENGLYKPFLYMGKDPENGGDPTIAPFFEKLRGPNMMVRVKGATHYSYIDYPLLLTTMTVPPELKPRYEELVGTVEGERIMSIVITLLRGWLDLTLRGDSRILSTVETRFPEIIVMERCLEGACK